MRTSQIAKIDNEINRRPKLHKVLQAIGTVSFSEIVRDKILYNAVLCALILIGVAYLGARLSFVQQSRIILSFGSSAISVACTLIGILIGAILVSREFDRRTVFVLLSKPITRFEFLLGKYFGLVLVLGLNWLILGAVFLSVYGITGGIFSSTLFAGLFFYFLQSLVMGAIAIFVASFSTTSLAITVSIGLYLIGNNISQLRFLATRTQNFFGRSLLEGISLSLPNLEHFNLGFKLIYDLPVDSTTFFLSSLYAFLIIFFFLLLSGVVIHKREI